MPKSKTHEKRKKRLKKRKESFDSLIKKRVKRFREMPISDQVRLMGHWQGKPSSPEEES